eukprot:3880685-Pyramimonas_sp.AAC.1
MDAGAEDRIWSTQLGFRSERGTADTVFVARRVIEDAWATMSGSTMLLALDWAKAFDSVAPDALVTSLKRFGCPNEFVDMVKSICNAR